MAINDAHFKEPTIITATSGPSEFPTELIAVAGGVLVLFVIGAFIYWRRISGEQDAPGT